jgi:hypothetical protein
MSMPGVCVPFLIHAQASVCVHGLAVMVMDRWIDPDSYDRYCQLILSVSFFIDVKNPWVKDILYIFFIDINYKNFVSMLLIIGTHSIDSVDPSVKPISSSKEPCFS